MVVYRSATLMEEHGGLWRQNIASAWRLRCVSHRTLGELKRLREKWNTQTKLEREHRQAGSGEAPPQQQRRARPTFHSRRTGGGPAAAAASEAHLSF